MIKFEVVCYNLPSAMSENCRHILKVSFSNEDFESIAEAARQAGQSPEQWIEERAMRLAPSPQRMNDSMQRLLERIDRQEARSQQGVLPKPSEALMRFAGCVSIDDPTWSDNERIDRELGEEYDNLREDGN